MRMAKERFRYNTKSHMLHIKGYCTHTKGITDYLPFNSENEVLAYDGRAVGFCKICQKKRERLLEERR